MTKSKSNLSLLAWILAILFLALSIFMWYGRNQFKTQLAKSDLERVELENIQTELETDYQSSLSDLEDLRGDNQELNDLIDTQTEDLRKQKDKINGLIWTQRELGKAKEEMENMKSQVSGYIANINRLKDENASLTANNQTLSSENTVLSTDLTQAKSDINRLDSTRVVLSTMRDDLTSENTNLAEKVDLAEAIKINSISVEGMKAKSSGDLKATNKAKNVKVLRSCILTETNMVTPAGEEVFYVRIMSPQGETLAVESSGSGTLTNKLNGEEIRYTTSGSVQYDQKDTNVCIDYTPNAALGKGNYAIEIYNKDYMVGKGSFLLK